MTRMQQIAIAAAALAAAVTTLPAAAQTDMPSWTENRTTIASKLDRQFQAMDRNHDGRVSRTEYDAYWERQFARADTRHDGRLDEAEAHAAAGRLNGGHVATEGGFARMWKQASRHGSMTERQYLAYHDRLFHDADIRNRGWLTETEMRRALRARQVGVAAL